MSLFLKLKRSVLTLHFYAILNMILPQTHYMYIIWPKIVKILLISFNSFNKLQTNVSNLYPEMKTLYYPMKVYFYIYFIVASCRMLQCQVIHISYI